MMPGQDSGGLPLTNMEEAATMMHEMYVTLQRAGFSAGDALKIVTDMITQVMIAGTQAGMFGSSSQG